MAFRSGNPALNPQYFQGGMASEKMTLLKQWLNKNEKNAKNNNLYFLY